MKKTFFIILFFGCFLTSKAQIKNDSLQVFTFPEVEKLQKKNPKPMLVFIYTDWCKICYGMKRNTFNNQEIIKKLNDNFYFIKLNAEEKNDITFLGKTFVYKPNGANSGVHELAKSLGTKDKKISYPTTVILNTRLEIDLQIDSYLDSEKMNLILNEYLKKN